MCLMPMGPFSTFIQLSENTVAGWEKGRPGIRALADNSWNTLNGLDSCEDMPASSIKVDVDCFVIGDRILLSDRSTEMTER